MAPWCGCHSHVQELRAAIRHRRRHQTPAGDGLVGSTRRLHNLTIEDYCGFWKWPNEVPESGPWTWGERWLLAGHLRLQLCVVASRASQPRSAAHHRCRRKKYVADHVLAKARRPWKSRGTGPSPSSSAQGRRASPCPGISQIAPTGRRRSSREQPWWLKLTLRPSAC